MFKHNITSILKVLYSKLPIYHVFFFTFLIDVLALF